LRVKVDLVVARRLIDVVATFQKHMCHDLFVETQRLADVSFTISLQGLGVAHA